MDMYSRVCVVCKQKNSSRNLNQLRVIEQFVKQKISAKGIRMKIANMVCTVQF